MSIIISEGRYGIITYKTEKEWYNGNIYKVTCNPELILLAKNSFCEFVNNSIPKYGKYEVEEFVARMLIISLITGDITELMNTNISYNDYPYGGSCDYSKNTIKESILQFCEVLSTDDGIIKLKYHGKEFLNS